MFRFWREKTSFGPASTATKILHLICDKNNFSTNLKMENFDAARNELAAIIEDKLDYTVYQLHSMGAKDQIRNQIADAIINTHPNFVRKDDQTNRIIFTIPSDTFADSLSYVLTMIQSSFSALRYTKK